MAAGYWIKLYQDILKDPKMGRLPDSAWRRCIELFLMAGEQDCRDGCLPPVEDMAWELHISQEQLTADITILERAGILMCQSGQWLVKNFSKRQAAVPVAERVKRHRERAVTQPAPEGNEQETIVEQAGNESVTKGYTDIDIDKDKETDKSVPNGTGKNGKRGENGKGPKDADRNKPYGLYLELEQLQNGINQGQTLADAKKLFDRGHTADEILACASWLLTDPWMENNHIALNSGMIVRKITGWKKSGMPSVWQVGTSNGQPPAEPKSFAAIRQALGDN
jgi:hypothetical protein